MREESIQRFYSNGKLLLTGEYLVLHGAVALSLPCVYGQHLYIHESRDPETGTAGKILYWKADVKSTPWFDCWVDPSDWNYGPVDHSGNRMDRSGSSDFDEGIAIRLIRILKAADELRMGSGNEDPWLRGVRAISKIGFDLDWGLGSSSTLISNIAWWAGVDPYRLNQMVSSGSGYDVASARHNCPILYERAGSQPRITELEFKPEFKDQLGFLHLGNKQDSREGVKNFLDHALVKEKNIKLISEISHQVASSSNLTDYEEVLEEHERILSGILERPAIKNALFPDYPGMVKSMGAWGGDFVHISMKDGLEAARQYFEPRGFSTLIPYGKMIKSSHL